MTMFKTKEQIEEMARSFCIYHGFCKEVDLNGEGATEEKPEGDAANMLVDAISRFQQDIKEACNVGFDECFSKYATESNLHHEFDAYYFWQAAKLDSMKELQENQLKIKKCQTN